MRVLTLATPLSGRWRVCLSFCFMDGDLRYVEVKQFDQGHTVGLGVELGREIRFSNF